MRRIIVYTILFASSLSVKSFCQTGKDALPVSVFTSADTAKPVLFYISGDGGWNKFSTAFVQSLNKKGYEIVGLDAKEYFWHKKTAQQTAKDVSSLIEAHMKNKKTKSFVLIGYSFGADVAPFVVTDSNADIMANLKYLILMSPSGKTDFEVHITELIGIRCNSGISVPAAINKITQPVLFVFGNKEDDFPLKDVSIKNYKRSSLPGGHHYDGDPAAVCDIILTYLK